MQVPCIHLNGTSKDDLLYQLEVVSNSLQNAYVDMKRAAPNGRDYYPLGAEAFTKAVDEHMDRLRRVDAVKKEIDALAQAIDEIR